MGSLLRGEQAFIWAFYSLIAAFWQKYTARKIFLKR
jgi:hypothetical protein